MTAFNESKSNLAAGEPIIAGNATISLLSMIGMGSAYGDFIHFAGLTGGDSWPCTVDAAGNIFFAASDVNSSSAIYSGAAWSAILKAIGAWPGGMTFTETHRTHRLNNYDPSTCNPANHYPSACHTNTLLAIGTDLYRLDSDIGEAAFVAANPTATWDRGRVGKSIDGGSTWTYNSTTFPGTASDWDVTDGLFQGGGYIQFGPGYTNVPDRCKNVGVSYVYQIDGFSADRRYYYIMRVPSTDVQNVAAWEYWDGAGWTSTYANKSPIMDANNYPGVTLLSWGVSCVYHRAFNRFFLFASTETADNTIALFQSYEPQGPYSLVSTYTVGSGGDEKIMPRIFPEGVGMGTDFSSGTLTAYAGIGGYAPTGSPSWDDLHVVQVTLTPEL